MTENTSHKCIETSEYGNVLMAQSKGKCYCNYVYIMLLCLKEN